MVDYYNRDHCMDSFIFNRYVIERLINSIIVMHTFPIINIFAVGNTVAPGGHLFQLVVLVVAANFGGFLMSLTTMPRLIGMLATGILLQVSFSFILLIILTI